MYFNFIIDKTLSRLKEKLKRWSKNHEKSALVELVDTDDPAVEEYLIPINADDRLFVISQSGDNALHYLLKKPKKITLYSPIATQRYLIELKLLFFKMGDFEKLFLFFGKGYYPSARNFYNKFIKAQLSVGSQLFWNKHISLFTAKTKPAGFYFSGAAGQFSKALYKSTVEKTQVLSLIKKFYQSQQLEHRISLAYKLNSALSKPLAQINFKRLAFRISNGNTMPSEYYLRAKFQSYFENRFSQLLRNQSPEDLYFWKNFFFGYYAKNSCPSYLQNECFDTISEQLNKIDLLGNEELESVMLQCKKKFSVFYLSDYIDRLQPNSKDELRKLFKQLAKHATPAAKMVLRSNVYQYNDLLYVIPKSFLLTQIENQELQQFDSIGLHQRIFLITHQPADN